MSSNLLMSSLPEEVIEKILLGVPAFDLVRCKAVCKVWRSLISSADFAAAHLQRSKSDPSSHHILVRNHRPEAVAGPFSSLICFSSKDLSIVGSVNGLLCITGKGELSPDNIWIWNPVTRLSSKLPYSSNGTRGRNMKLAFWCDDDVNGVYKLAKISTYPDRASVLELWVSTSPDNWTVISTFEFDFPYHCWFHACDVGLAAYWIFASDGEIIIESLDFKSLALTKFAPLSNRQLQLPNNFKSCLFCGNLSGEFALGAYNLCADIEYYDIWTPVMDDSKAPLGWIKKFSICLDPLPFDNNCLGIVNDKLVITSYSYKELALYDPLTGMLEVVETDDKVLNIRKYSACGFVGSLVSIDGFQLETNDPLCKYMCISWPYSLYPSAHQKENKGRRMKSCQKERRRKTKISL